MIEVMLLLIVFVVGMGSVVAALGILAIRKLSKHARKPAD